MAYRLAPKEEPREELPFVEEGFDYEWFKDNYHKIEDALKGEGVISLDNRPFKGKPRAKQVVNIERVPPCNFSLPCLFGDEALRV